MPTEFPSIHRTLIVNDEPNDTQGQLSPGEEALDGDSNAVITIVRSTLAPTAADIRPHGQLWIQTTTQRMWWSRAGGLWYEFCNAATIPSHQETHQANGADPLPWLTINGRGLLSARPPASPSNAGYFFDAIDVKRLYRSNGSAWEVVAGADLASEYEHVQASPSTLWTVTHNLGRRPKSVAIRDSSDTVVHGGVIHISPNQLTISFGHPFSGTAVVG